MNKFAVILFSLLYTLIVASQEVIMLENCRELFIDKYLIEDVSDVSIKMTTPVSAGPVLFFNDEWEGKFSGGYVSVVHNDGHYGMYYRGTGNTPKRALRGLYRYVSADGIKWTLKDSVALFTNVYSIDSQNVLAWLPSENQYAIYLRTWTDDKPEDDVLLKGIRTIARSVSTDFIHWSEPELMDFGGAPVENLYTNATQPYYRTSHILISMPFRFSENSRVLTHDEMIESGIDKSMWKGVSDAVLMSSRGGYSYDRMFMESFVRPGSDQANWAARSTIPALGIIPTGLNEISFFLTRRSGTRDCYLERMKLRVDGFSSLTADYKEGYAITKPMYLNGGKFLLNFSTSSIGYVKIVVLDENGCELEGFGEDDAIKIIGDKVDFQVKWENNRTVECLRNNKIRLKFLLRDADIYSFAIFD